MKICYFELRQKVGITPQNQLAADIARHLQSRQHLGRAIIVCESPLSFLSTLRKHWLKQARTLQKQRASTVNAEKILRLTNSITRMHRMQFTARPPEEHPQAHVFFVAPDQINMIPMDTFSVYVACPLPTSTLTAMYKQLPNEALLIDYTAQLDVTALSFRSKTELRQHLEQHWQQVIQFLAKHNIDIDQLTQVPRTIGAIDDALDTLLGFNRQFLQVASDFQHILELAQPQTLNAQELQQHDVIALLAHRVQVLSPHAAGKRFIHDTSEDNSFFLHDVETETMSLSEILEYHKQAGRTRLAQALTFNGHRL